MLDRSEGAKSAWLVGDYREEKGEDVEDGPRNGSADRSTPLVKKAQA